MKNLDKKEWDFSNGEKYAIKWFEQNGFEVIINSRYVSVTIFTVTKDGITDKFRLPDGDGKINYKKFMEQYGKNFKILCELQELRKLANKQ